MEDLIKRVKSIQSFLPHPQDSNYTLTEVDDLVKEKLIRLIQKLEDIPQVYFCTRGDSKTNIKAYQKFFEEDLSKIFIVGSKSRSAVERSTNPSYNHFSNNTINLINEIGYLTTLINKKIQKIPPDHRVGGFIGRDFNVYLDELDQEQLEGWKVFFLSFLHNYGKAKNFKNYSPFISLTYGRNKYRISRKFALSRNKFGFIYLYSLNSGWPYYIKTSDFTKKLNKLGIRWYPDTHKEIILVNGMYPHFMIGIFEVKKTSNPRFVVNPWLYQQLVNNQPFDYRNGVSIDQNHFQEFALELEYRNFFFHYLDSDLEFNSELTQFDHNRNLRP